MWPNGDKRTKCEIVMELKLEPTEKEICMMCHFSSECGQCCNVCKKQCNSRQICMQGCDGQFDRLKSWLDLIKSNDSLKRLRKYV